MFGVSENKRVVLAFELIALSIIPIATFFIIVTH